MEAAKLLPLVLRKISSGLHLLHEQGPVSMQAASAPVELKKKTVVQDKQVATGISNTL